MRELILKNCNVILDSAMSSIYGLEEASSLITAQGDIDGDGQDEIVICSHSRILTVIKGSQVYRITNRKMDSSLCSVHVFPITGNQRAEIITISLTGVCSVYMLQGSLDNNECTAVPHSNQNNNQHSNYNHNASMTSLEIPIYDIDKSENMQNQNQYQNQNQNQNNKSFDLSVCLSQSIITRNATVTKIFM